LWSLEQTIAFSIRLLSLPSWVPAGTGGSGPNRGPICELGPPAGHPSNHPLEKVIISGDHEQQ
jgi:hypothetical protein